MTLHGVDHIAGSGAALPNHLRNVCRSDALVVLGLRSLWLKAVSANPVGLANLNLTNSWGKHPSWVLCVSFFEGSSIKGLG